MVRSGCSGLVSSSCRLGNNIRKINNLKILLGAELRRYADITTFCTYPEHTPGMAAVAGQSRRRRGVLRRGAGAVPAHGGIGVSQK